jgi:hypothetical protein
MAMTFMIVSSDPVFSRWTLPDAPAVAPVSQLTHPKERLQRFSPQERRWQQ